MDKNKPEVIISDWNITRVCPFTGRLFSGFVLTGYAQGHPTLGNDRICTSIIVKINFKKNKVETMNTIYKLNGKPFDWAWLTVKAP